MGRKPSAFVQASTHDGLQDRFAVLDHDVEVDFTILVLLPELRLGRLERSRETLDADRRGVLCLPLCLNQAGMQLAHSSIRFGLGRFTTEEEVDFVADLVIAKVKRLRDVSPLWEMHKEGIDLKSIEWAAH